MALPSQIDAAARGQSKPVSMKVFDNVLDTIEDAAAGQWATFTVDVITHARRAQLPREDLLELLAMLGIVEGQASRRGSDGKTIPPRATCTGCRHRHDLTKNGLIRSHKVRGEYCEGRHRPPAAEPLAVAS